MSFIIETHDLCKSFNGFQAVKSLNLKVKKGEIFGFLGPNGAGKSTTINILTSLLLPTSGTARVCGFDIVKDNMEVRRRIGIVPQEVILEGELTARENIMFYGRLYHIPKNKIEERIPGLLELAELTDRADSPVKTFSGGMKRRLEIAKAFLHEPQLIFLDEPTIGLDIQTRKAIWDKILELKERGVTVFLTTHYMEEADELCDRVAIMDYGEIKALGTPQELKYGVGKGDIIDITVSAHAEKFAQMIRKKGMQVQVKENSIRFVRQDGCAVVADIIRSAEKSGVKIEKVSMHQLSMDDVFIHYTGRAIRDEAGKQDAIVKMWRAR